MGLRAEFPQRKNQCREHPLTFTVKMQTNHGEPFPVLNYIIHSTLQSGRFGTPTTNLQNSWKDKNKTKESGPAGSVSSAL